MGDRIRPADHGALVRRWTLAAFNLALSAAWAGEEPVLALARAGEAVYAASQSRLFVVRGDGKETLSQPPFRVAALAVSEGSGGDGGAALRLVVAGGDPGVSGQVAVIDPRSGRVETSRREGDDLVYGVAVSNATGRPMAALARADGEVSIRLLPDLAPRVPAVRFRHAAVARAVAFSPDGAWVASAGLGGVVWRGNVRDPGEGAVLVDHTAGVETLAFSPDSRWLASGARDSRVRVHRVMEGRLVRTYQGIDMADEPVAGRRQAHICSLAWGRVGPGDDGQELLLAGTSKGGVFLLSTTDDRWVEVARVGPAPVRALAVLPAGDVVAAADTPVWIGRRVTGEAARSLGRSGRR